ncbi:N-6 DNA methylase [Methanosphaera sp.]
MTDTKKYNHLLEQIDKVQKNTGIRPEITYYVTLELLFYNAINNSENKYHIQLDETIYDETRDKFYLNTLNNNFNQIRESKQVFNDLYLIENYNIYNKSRLESLNTLYKEIYKITKPLDSQEQEILYRTILNNTQHKPKLRKIQENMQVFKKLEEKLIEKHAQKDEPTILEYNITATSLTIDHLEKSNVKLHAYVNDIIEYSLILMLITIKNIDIEQYNIILKNNLFTDTQDTKYDVILNIPEIKHNNWIQDIKEGTITDNIDQLNIDSYKTIHNYLKEEGILLYITRENDLYLNNYEETRRDLTENQYITSIISTSKEINKLFGKQEYILLIKDEKREDKIYFININYQPTDKDVDYLMEIYDNPQEITDMAHLTTIHEIRENNYNLNFTRYINLYHKNNIELNNIINNIHELEKENIEKNKEIQNSCAKLGIYLY